MTPEPQPQPQQKKKSLVATAGMLAKIAEALPVVWGLLARARNCLAKIGWRRKKKVIVMQLEPGTSCETMRSLKRQFKANRGKPIGVILVDARIEIQEVYMDLKEDDAIIVGLPYENED